MHIGPWAGAASLAGARLAQSQAATSQAAGETAELQRAAAADQAAEAAAGIAPTEHEVTTSDRDADGRQAWRFRDGLEDDAESDPPAVGGDSGAPPPRPAEGGTFEIWA